MLVYFAVDEKNVDGMNLVAILVGYRTIRTTGHTELKKKKQNS